MAMRATADGFEIRPQGSLGLFGLRIAVAVLAVFSLATAILFVALGAWPVTGFLGLDVLLLAWALWASHRRNRLSETILLTPAALTVRRVEVDGTVESWSMQPYWLQVRHDDGVVLRSHGRERRIGTFLPPEEQAALAHQLRDSLALLLQPEHVLHGIESRRAAGDP